VFNCLINYIEVFTKFGIDYLINWVEAFKRVVNLGLINYFNEFGLNVSSTGPLLSIEDSSKICDSPF
jgi:hypothetical protein